MTVPTQDNPGQMENPSAKEINFRKQEQAMKEHYERQLQEARVEKERLARELEERKRIPLDEEDEDHEPYVDKKKLKKELGRFGQQTMQQTQSEIQNAVQTALREERKANWISANSDFYDVLGHADKLAQTNPALAETILQMPEGFERQKLVYQNIKAMGLDKPAQKQPTIQDKVDANRRSPYYQPSTTGTAPYSAQGDYSPAGQKSAYDHVQKLKAQLRI